MKNHPVASVCIVAALAFGAAACERTEDAPPPQTVAPEPPPAPVTSAPLPSTAPAAMPSGPVAGAEREFVTQAAASGMAEVEASRLVASRTEDPALKRYAEELERAHRATMEELQRIAASKGIDLPATTEGEPRERLNRLNGLSGGDLRRAFLEEFGVQSHRQAIELFERQARDGQDAELRQFAEQTLPTLREHLVQAQQLQGGGAGGAS